MEDPQFSSYTEQASIYARLWSLDRSDPQWACQESRYFSSILSKSNCVTTSLIDLPSLLGERPISNSKFNNGTSDISEFTYHPSNPLEPLVLFDCNGNPVAARVPLNDPHALIPSLENSVRKLPLKLAAGKSVATRGGFRVFAYGVHADYSPEPRYNADYISHQPASSAFISNDAKPAIDILSRWYRFLRPSEWAETQNVVLPAGLERRAGPWTTLTINVPDVSRPQDGEGTIKRSVVSKPHTDVLDHKLSMTGVIPFRWDGNWEKGRVVLFPLKAVLEVGRGEAYLMFGAAMHHGNLPDEESGRGSLVCHSRASIHNWWTKQQLAALEREREAMRVEAGGDPQAEI